MRTYTIKYTIITQSGYGSDFTPVNGGKLAAIKAARIAASKARRDELVFVAFQKRDGTRGFIAPDGSARFTGIAYSQQG